MARVAAATPIFLGSFIAATPAATPIFWGCVCCGHPKVLDRAPALDLILKCVNFTEKYNSNVYDCFSKNFSRVRSFVAVIEYFINSIQNYAFMVFEYTQ